MSRNSTLPNSMVEVEERTLRAISPVRPASDEILKTVSWSGSRLNAGRSLPPPYLVYFLLVELLGYKDFGQAEKVAWSVPIEFEGNLFFVEHRKFGLGIFASVSSENEEKAARIVKLIHKGVKAATQFFDYLAAEAVSNSQLNVTNNSPWLFSRYEFLCDEFHKAKAVAETRKDEREVTHRTYPNGSIGTSISNPSFRLGQEAGWLGIAAIEAFFSWTEHVLIHLAILQGKVVTGDAVAKLAGADWSEKFRTALDITDSETKAYFDELLETRRQIRNFIAHGAFGKQNEAFHFHSSAGAVPVRLTDPDHQKRYSIFGHPAFDESAALATAEEFIKHLWSGNLEPARLYIQESGLPVILTYASNGRYEAAMQSVDDMEEFMDVLCHQADNAANMDW
jgi:hypothetical protein